MPSTLARFFKERRVKLTIILCATILWGGILWRQFQNAPVEDRIRAGQDLLQEGHSSDAEAKWKEATHLAPNDARAWELLGDLHLSAGSYKAALQDFQHVLQLEPKTDDLRGRMALAAFKDNDKASARRFAEAQLKDDANNLTALQVLVNTEKSGVDNDAKVEYLQHIVALQPQNAEFLIALSEELSSRGEFDKVVPLANRLVALSPTPSAYFRRGLAVYSANPDKTELKHAQEDFEKVLTLDPSSVEAHRYLGRIAMRLDQTQEAIKQFEAIGQGRPYASAHLMELSQAYRKAGNIRRAEVLSARYTHLKQINVQWLDIADETQKVANKVEPLLKLGQLILGSIEADSPTYELYRYQISQNKLQSVESYFNAAKHLDPKNMKVDAALIELNKIYNNHLQDGLQALTAKKKEIARTQFEHAIVLCPSEKLAHEGLARLGF